MSIWNKVLLGFIFLAALGFWYLSMRTLQTQSYWRGLVEKYEQKVEQTEKENANLEEADVAEDDDAAIKELVATDESGEKIRQGIKWQRRELNKLYLSRGRVWRNCGRQQVSPTGGVSVQTDQPTPNGIAPKTVVQVFEESDVQNGGRYLGEFKVENAADQQVVLEPTRKLSAEEIQAIAQSQSPWTIYEKMPTDSNETFAGMDEDTLRQLLPESSIEEYLRDRTPAEPDDPPDRLSVNRDIFLPPEDVAALPAELIDEAKGDGTEYYFRRLRDYAALMEMYDRKQAELYDSNEATQRDYQLVQGALADAEKQKTFREQEKAELTQDESQIVRERDAVASHQQELQRRTSLIRQEIEQIKQTNKAMAGQLAKIQLSTARQINERTRRMVQSTPDGS